MGSLRFYRRVHLFPGVSVNLSKSGPSLTVGVRGAHLTMGRRGVTRTVGIPGTGIYYTSHDGYHTGFHSGHHDAPVTPEEQARADRQAGCSVLILALGIIGVFWLLVSALVNQ